MINYPPGVTGFELEIAGPDYERETDQDCPREDCEGKLLEQGYRGRRWVVCAICDYQADGEDGEADWCCDAGPIGHPGRHWKEE